MRDVTTADQFMRRKLVTLDAGTGVLDGVARLLRDNISGAPVVTADGRYLGVFSEKCCMNALTECVELAGAVGIHLPAARDFMTCDLISLSPDIDVFEAIDHLLSRRISGAPVLDPDGAFLGIFSEKTAMQVLVSAAYDQLPGTNVRAYMNTDPKRIVSEDSSLVEVAHKFQQTHYRRLPVLRGNLLEGQISRRDVLHAEHRIAKVVAQRTAAGDADERLSRCNLTSDVATHMDVHAATITSQADLLSIAQVFLNSPYRRLPVVDDGLLVGQVSRRDLLEAAASLLRPQKEHRRGEPLYLSPLAETRPPSLG